jgi:hypothetical protein
MRTAAIVSGRETIDAQASQSTPRGMIERSVPVTFQYNS